MIVIQLLKLRLSYCINVSILDFTQLKVLHSVIFWDSRSLTREIHENKRIHLIINLCLPLEHKNICIPFGLRKCNIFHITSSILHSLEVQSNNTRSPNYQFQFSISCNMLQMTFDCLTVKWSFMTCSILWIMI